MRFVRNMLCHLGWGVLAVILFILHFLWDAPIFLSALAFLVWILRSSVSNTSTYLSRTHSVKKEVQKPNKNPYSLKTEDILPSAKREAEEKAHNEKLALEALELKLEEAEKMLNILNLPKEEKAALLDALRAEKNASPRRLLELLSQKDTLIYVSETQPYWDIVRKLDSSAKKAGLSFIPANIMGASLDLQGMRAVEHIAAGIEQWSIFAILDNTEFGNGFYIGCTAKDALAKLIVELQSYLRGEYEVIACVPSENQ